MFNLYPCFKALPQLSVQFVHTKVGRRLGMSLRDMLYHIWYLCLCDFASAYTITNYND